MPIPALLAFAVPVLAILFAAYVIWLQYENKQKELGPSTQEIESKLRSLQNRLEEIEEERETLQQRLQNLETIVTSETWIAQHEEGSGTPTLDAGKADELMLPTDNESESASGAERTADIAQRLRNE